MGKASVIAAALLLALACADPPSGPTTDVQLARGSKGGKPAAAEITEFWITDGNLIHLAGTGTVSTIKSVVAYDFWENGYQDDDDSDHYEYRFPGLLYDPVEVNTDGQGGWWVDFEWNGERDEAGLFRDQRDDGPDHFVFSFGMSSGVRSVGGLTPDGVMGGEDVPAGATSYAFYWGADPEGVFATASFELAGASCEVVTTGRGKRATTQTVVSATVTPNLSGGPQTLDYFWWEFHLKIDDALQERQTETGIGGTSFLLTATLDGAVPQIELDAVLDYVVPLGLLVDYNWDGVEQTATAGTVTCSN